MIYIKLSVNNLIEVKVLLNPKLIPPKSVFLIDNTNINIKPIKISSHLLYDWDSVWLIKFLSLRGKNNYFLKFEYDTLSNELRKICCEKNWEIR